ncbi:MAG: hypothetical protein ABI779_25430 [Acidobacteriota bacterium]
MGPPQFSLQRCDNRSFREHRSELHHPAMSLTERLGEEGLAEYMSANRLDRAEAVKAIKRSR